jgi:hypothetical protein
MAKPTKRDLFATLEDDLKQFRDALFGVLRAAPRCDCEASGADHAGDYRAREHRQGGQGEGLKCGAAAPDPATGASTMGSEMK